MRQALNLGMVAAAAATSILSLPGSSAFAASGADGQAAGSPGILSGNTIQAPLDVPVNACGNSVDVVAALNPTFGNSCTNDDGSRPSSTRDGGSGRAAGGAVHGTGDHGNVGGDDMSGGGAHARSDTQRSPGILSGNSVQAPVDAPVNVCGNSGNVVGVANPAMGNHCSSGVATSEEISEVPPPTVRTVEPPATVQPPAVQRLTPPHAKVPVQHTHVTGGRTQLAQTGADQDLLAAAAASAGLLIGGGILYRRGRTAAR
ncbi:chaplin [Streptomyces sp. AcE210]|uniref:chaplin n=1 Tax=Streptomyces sp. AcE210 TaxID=2292703 RepID=UPI000E304950|nr:chaplin [Streptomyces sp. AcE210]RFC73155.1 chaplin [Streptomyces sp. AcE210]